MGNAKKIVLTVVVTVLATIIILGIPFYFLIVKDVEKLEKENDSLSNNTNDIVAPLPISAPTELPVGPKLIKKTVQGKELVVAFSNQYDVVTQWGDWLFVGDKNYGTKDKKAQVWAYNIKTDEKKKIFDFSLDAEGLDVTKDNAQYVNALQIFENKLFVSLGGYMMPGYVYAIALDSEMLGAPVFVGQSKNPYIKYLNGVYFVNGGEGDAGCFWGEVNKLDMTKLSLVKLYEMSGCIGEDDESIIGNDDKYLYVSANKYIADKTVPESGLGVYQPVDLRAVSLESPTEIKNIFKKGELSPNLKTILIVNKVDGLFLIGSKLIKYDLQSLDEVITVALPKSEHEVSFDARFADSKNVLCAYVYEDATRGYLYEYAFDLIANKFNEIPAIERGTSTDPCYEADKVSEETVPGVINKLKAAGTLSAEFEYLDE